MICTQYAHRVSVQMPLAPLLFSHVSPYQPVLGSQRHCWFTQSPWSEHEARVVHGEAAAILSFRTQPVPVAPFDGQKGS